jgi:hypothetical protein
MNPTAMFIAALVLLPAVGLGMWTLLAMDQVERELRDFTGLEGLHFETSTVT